MVMGEENHLLDFKLLLLILLLILRTFELLQDDMIIERPLRLLQSTEYLVLSGKTNVLSKGFFALDGASPLIEELPEIYLNPPTLQSFQSQPAKIESLLRDLSEAL